MLIYYFWFEYERRRYHTICYFNFQNTTAFETIALENNVQILWLLPQFIIMTAGEIMFSITTMQFSFTQVIKMILVSNKFMLKTQDIRTTLYQSHNLLLGSSQYEGRNASHEVSHKCIWKYHRCCCDCRFRGCFQ